MDVNRNATGRASPPHGANVQHFMNRIILSKNSTVASLALLSSPICILRGIFRTELLRERVNEFLTQIDIAMETAA